MKNILINHGIGNYISNNPNITMEIIEKYPNKPWNWKYISLNLFQKHKYYKYRQRKIIKKYWKQYKNKKIIKLKNKFNKIICNDLLNVLLNFI